MITCMLRVYTSDSTQVCKDLENIYCKNYGIGFKVSLFPRPSFSGSSQVEPTERFRSARYCDDHAACQETHGVLSIKRKKIYIIGYAD